MASSLSGAAGEDKDLRMQASSSPLGYNVNSLEDPINPALDKPRASDPNPAAGGGSKSKPRISYRECLKNHAANIGGHVTDGCGEFMPSGEEATIEALKCAACNCHRNFHRKEHHGESVTTTAGAAVHPLQLPIPLPSPSMSHHRVGGWGPMVYPMKMAFGGGGGGTDSSSEDLNFNAFHSSGALAQFGSKKRFRTKFTTEQKERMLEFAEKLGWRIPREDDSEVQRFCAEVGVKRQVFKVWMHNNKNNSSSKKNPQDLIN